MWNCFMRNCLSCWMVILAVVVASCESKPTNFYYLESLGPPPSGPSDHQARLVIEEVTLPPYLDRFDIVSQQQANRLDVSDVEQWAEPLDDAFARVLRSDLSNLLADKRVLVVPANFTEAEASVFVDVSRFEVVEGEDSAVLEAQWRIVRARDGRELVLERSLQRAAVTGEGYGAITAALNETLHGLSRDISAAMTKQIQQRRI